MKTKEEFEKECINDKYSYPGDTKTGKVLYTYINGNHYECIFDDGTLYRETLDPEADHFIYSYPSNFDFKINNKCDGGCRYCHENSVSNGATPSLKALIGTPFLNSLKPGTSVALGGGNIFESPDLQDFLVELKRLGIITNITVNQAHISKNFGQLKYFIDNKLVHGVGISFTKRDEDDFTLIDKLGDNVVIHVINGILRPGDLKWLGGRKILILGYKDLRRGHTLLESSESEIKKNQDWLKYNLPKLKLFSKVLSFDCLGIEQLHPKEILGMSEREYKEIYLGDDTDVHDEQENITCATMYIDLPNMQVSRMSTAPLDKRVSFTTDETIEDLFKKSVIGW